VENGTATDVDMRHRVLEENRRDAQIQIEELNREQSAGAAVNTDGKWNGRCKGGHSDGKALGRKASSAG
jgi:hypothetical protein